MLYNDTDRADLFEISVRGSLAYAFYLSHKHPTKQQWEMLQGKRDITLRDIGEVSYATGISMDLEFVDAKNGSNAEGDS
jgi:hypothetical protein